MRSLLEQLETERNAYVREHRASPAVRLTRTGRNDAAITAVLSDVGSDYIEVRGFYVDSPIMKIFESFNTPAQRTSPPPRTASQQEPAETDEVSAVP